MFNGTKNVTHGFLIVVRGGVNCPPGHAGITAPKPQPAHLEWPWRSNDPGAEAHWGEHLSPNQPCRGSPALPPRIKVTLPSAYSIDYRLAAELSKLPPLTPISNLDTRFCAVAAAAELSCWALSASNPDQKAARKLAAKAILQMLGTCERSLNLTRLFLDSGCALESLPDVLKKLPGLELTLDPETLASVCSELPLYSLKALSCRSAKVVPSQLPFSLERLCLDDSPGIAFVPCSGPHAALKEFSVCRCELVTLPTDFGSRYPNAKRVFLGENELTTLPDSISLQPLEVLALMGNPVRSIPSCPQLQVLDVRDTGLKGTPSFVTKAQRRVLQMLITPLHAEATQARFQKEPSALDGPELMAAIADLERAAELLHAKWLQPDASAPTGSPKWQDVDDFIYLPAIVAAENALTPGLALRCPLSLETLFNDLKQMAVAAQNLNQTQGPVRFLVETVRATETARIDEMTHTVVLEAVAYFHKGGKPVLSVVALEPMTQDHEFSKPALEKIGFAFEQLNINFRSTLLGTCIQKTDFGCGIFSASLAKKMHDHRDVIEGLHAGNVYGGPFKYMDSEALCASFFKHTTSQTTVEGLKNRTDGRELVSQIVNSKGQTLLERIAAGKVTRPYKDTKRSYCASIEAKRIQFLRRAAWNLKTVAHQRDLHPDVGQKPPSSSVLHLLHELIVNQTL
jgi:YopJ protease family